MKIRTKAKHGNTSEENEDAAEGDANFVAVADGATEAIYSRLWAQKLVESMFAAGTGLFWNDPVATFWRQAELASDRWKAQLPQGQLPWYIQHKTQQGSGAALALLMLDHQQQRWRGFAVGDVTIVQLRDHQKICAWPLDHSTQFNTSPSLVGTAVTPDRYEVPTYESTFHSGDHFLVMTDALAAWSLRCDEQSESRWDRLLGITTSQEWEAFVQEARLQGMRNDDVTLIQLETVEDVNAIPATRSIQRCDPEPTSNAERPRITIRND